MRHYAQECTVTLLLYYKLKNHCFIPLQHMDDIETTTQVKHETVLHINHNSLMLRKRKQKFRSFEI